MTLQEVRDKSTFSPISGAALDDDNDFTASPKIPDQEMIPPPAILDDPLTIPPITIERRSLRVRNNRNQDPILGHMQRAIQDSRESATRIREARDQGIPAFWEYRAPPQPTDLDAPDSGQE
ncbi:hypothetical protein C0991_005360, partial [Blastosporella zonata]